MLKNILVVLACGLSILCANVSGAAEQPLSNPF